MKQTKLSHFPLLPLKITRYPLNKKETVVAPAYRFFNTHTGAHLYTISETERDYILNELPHYNYEGIKFYVYPAN